MENSLSIHPPSVMTIAGSDSGGGAGIQADIKTFAALGCYGTSVITAVTAQNTIGVRAVHEVPVDNIADQIDAILDDMSIDAVKTGMLSSASIVDVVSDRVERYNLHPLVVDPVMVSATKVKLIDDAAVHAITERLIPLADVLTPNVYEAAVITGVTVKDEKTARLAGLRMLEMGARSVIVKGGHFGTEYATDLLLDASGEYKLKVPRINTDATHGTGCTFASAVAAGLARKFTIKESVEIAKEYVTEAMLFAFKVGKGKGPLNHLGKWWDNSCGPYAETK